MKKKKIYFAIKRMIDIILSFLRTNNIIYTRHNNCYVYKN